MLNRVIAFIIYVEGLMGDNSTLLLMFRLLGKNKLKLRKGVPGVRNVPYVKNILKKDYPTLNKKMITVKSSSHLFFFLFGNKSL